MQSFRSKFENQFFCIPERDHGIYVNMQYLRSNKLAARTFFRVFITHWGLRNAYSLGWKVIGQLITFPRQSRKISRQRQDCSLCMEDLSIVNSCIAWDWTNQNNDLFYFWSSGTWTGRGALHCPFPAARSASSNVYASVCKSFTNFTFKFFIENKERVNHACIFIGACFGRNV